MDQNERHTIVNAIGIVDKVLISIDIDKTQCATLTNLSDKYGNEYELYFANGGDQNNDSIPENSICREKEFVSFKVLEIKFNHLHGY